MPGANLRDAVSLATAINRLDGKERFVGVSAVLTPIKAGMRVEDVEPASEQEEDAKRIDPMSEANRQTVAIKRFTVAGGNSSEGTLLIGHELESRRFACAS